MLDAKLVQTWMRKSRTFQMSVIMYHSDLTWYWRVRVTNLFSMNGVEEARSWCSKNPGGTTSQQFVCHKTRNLLTLQLLHDSMPNPSSPWLLPKNTRSSTISCWIPPQPQGQAWGQAIFAEDHLWKAVVTKEASSPPPTLLEELARELDAPKQDGVTSLVNRDPFFIF